MTPIQLASMMATVAKVITLHASYQKKLREQQLTQSLGKASNLNRQRVFQTDD
jgi:hypothetical protein